MGPEWLEHCRTSTDASLTCSRGGPGCVCGGSAATDEVAGCLLTFCSYGTGVWEWGPFVELAAPSVLRLCGRVMLELSLRPTQTQTSLVCRARVRLRPQRRPLTPMMLLMDVRSFRKQSRCSGPQVNLSRSSLLSPQLLLICNQRRRPCHCPPPFSFLCLLAFRLC